MGSPDPADVEKRDLKAILFDLDGTLIDSFEGLARSYRHALSALGHPEPTDEEIRPCVGPPLRGNFARFLGVPPSDGVTAGGHDLVERAVALFRERYGAVGWTECCAYDGVLAMLEAVRARGLRAFVATGKPRVYAERIVERQGFAGLFEGVFGSRLDAGLDDKALLVAQAIRDVGLTPATTALVGDRDNDVRAAIANGLLPVGATWGYGSLAELTSAGATVLCASPSEVCRLLDA